MDNNGDKTLDMPEFINACKDFKINISSDEIKFLFNAFDRNKDNKLDYDEFLRAVKGEMNETRLKLVQKAFNILDKNRNGIIEISDIAQSYNANKHPAVAEGRKTEEQVLSEFLETFETHHNMA